ncbi:MAG: cation:proton antiporter [Pseudomonadota bacterium]
MTDFEWIAIGLNEVAWLGLAFGLGLLARSIGLPPLVGYLATGFLLSSSGGADTALLQKLSDLGITLLLFTVGLKLNLRTLARPQVWAVAGGHMLISVALFAALMPVLAGTGYPLFTGQSTESILLIAFALSFSSTVFVVKALEDRGEMSALYGRIAIGILLMQDIAAVIFLAISTGKAPSPWAALLLLLIPLRSLLSPLMTRLGHGELLVLFGFLLALGGAELFELLGLKGDLGALILGVIVASHSRADELAKAMLGFKDLFLLGFFLSVGLSGPLTADAFWIAALLAPLVLIKGVLFFFALVRSGMRARSSLLASSNLTNYSEFGLIVAALCVERGLLASEWLVVLAITLALSYVIAAMLNVVVDRIYTDNPGFWRRFQRAQLIADDQFINLGRARIAVIGMGGVGTGAYDELHRKYGATVVGVDIDPVTVVNQQAAGRTVYRGDPSDADFWDRIQASHTLELVLLSLPVAQKTLAVINRLRDSGFAGQVVATAKFPDEAEALLKAGASSVYNVYAEAGVGLAGHASEQAPQPS